jgi:hypothetical protein
MQNDTTKKKKKKKTAHRRLPSSLGHVEWGQHPPTKKNL